MCYETTERPQFGQMIHTQDLRLVWITLPGTDRSYALTEQQAYSLLRQLEEEVV